MLADYRPISNLPLMSKVLEKVLVSQFLDHLQRNSLFEMFQSSNFFRLNSDKTQVIVFDPHLGMVKGKRRKETILLNLAEILYLEPIISTRRLLTQHHWSILAEEEKIYFCVSHNSWALMTDPWPCSSSTLTSPLRGISALSYSYGHFLLQNHRASILNTIAPSSTHKDEMTSSIIVSWCKPLSKSAQLIHFALKKVITILEKDKNPKHVLLDAKSGILRAAIITKLHQADKPRLSPADYDNLLSINITPSCIFRVITLSPTNLPSVLLPP